MTNIPTLSSYNQQFALRHLPVARKAQGSDYVNVKKRPASWKHKNAAIPNGRKPSSPPHKTLIDAFKQHGMRLSDGARLNAVGKGIHVLGRVPSTVSAPVTALYLSQNNLISLDGIEQFEAVRLLSIGGNLISSDEEVERLNRLTQLRNLNLMGNPLCDQPNYRLRVIAKLKKLQMLDNNDITEKERDAASQVAAQDDVLRTMVTQNHFDIQKLQRIAQLIELHKTFYGYVLAGVTTGRFDRVPSPSDAACNVSLLLRLWKYEDALSEQELETLREQMLTIITRTHAKLAEHPKIKAKDYLLKLANGSSPRRHRRDGASNDIEQRCASWEEAYSNVIALQQKTIAGLYALCEKNRNEMVEFLKDVLSMDPRQRIEIAGPQRGRRDVEELEMVQLPRQETNRVHPSTESRLIERKDAHNIADLRSSHLYLPPQQQDPDGWDKETEDAPSRFPVSPSALVHQSSCKQSLQGKMTSQLQDLCYSNTQDAPAQCARDCKVNLRSGDFTNKSLGEAIHNFKLRDSAASSQHKLVKSVPLPTKIPQIYNVYTMQRQDNVALPPELVEKQRPPFFKYQANQRRRQSAAEFHGETYETGLDEENEVAVDYCYNQRPVSSTFNQEDFDTTSISEISRISSSPSMAHDRKEESYIPIARSLPIPSIGVQATSEPESARLLHRAPQRPQSGFDDPQNNVEHMRTTALPNDGRLQELEQREEKYIRALMQSEQRELDLRNNLSNVQRKLASYQRTLAQQLHEREAIKKEVTERTMAVATPKILKRFFIRWIQFYNWTQQVKHVQRKRCFILQHDRFWLWRRKVWMQQELRTCLKKHHRRVQKNHFIEWVNATRVSVIAKRNEMFRETQFLASVLRAWINEVASVKQKRKVQQDGIVYNLRRSCFREWKCTTRSKRALRRIQNLRWQDSQHVKKQVVFWSWKLFLFSVARPLQERSTQLRRRVQYRHTRLHLREWRKLIDIDKLHNFRLCRRVYRLWVQWHKRVQTEKHAAHKENIAVVRAFFGAWHTTAFEQATSRRSLNLAKRYVNRRRLQKLWMHWKYFSMAKRKYTQNSTKALKHYFKKLLRASWGIWKERSHTSMQRARINKFGALQRHFNAFQTGIQLVRTHKMRIRLLAHTKKRQQWSLLRRVTRDWGRYTTNIKRCKHHAQTLSVERNQGALHAVWRHWRSRYVNSLHDQLKTIRNAYNTAVYEKHELEAHLSEAKKTVASLSEQIEDLHERAKTNDKQAVDLEQTLRHCKEQKAHLENELKSAKVAIERERRAWEDALCEEEEKRESDSVKYRSLVQENHVLQVEMIELKREIKAEKAKVVDVETINEELRAAAKNTASMHHSEMTAGMDKQKELEQEIAGLRGHLKEQEKEREETANRLQEYEERIASTCEAMNEHERAHDREKEHLHNECSNLSVKWKEEQVKNAELSRLLQEKNQLILNMTHDTNHVESSAEFDPHRGHEQSDARHDNHEDCSRRDRYMMTKSLHRLHETRMPSMEFGHVGVSKTKAAVPKSCSLVVSNDGKHSTRQPIHSLPARQRNSHGISDELDSLTESNAASNEIMIDEHTSKVHEDIRLLQERLSKRLEQAPVHTQLSRRLHQRQRPDIASALGSPLSLCSSLSSEDSDTINEENRSVADLMRRARLRRIQMQKQAVISAVSPAVSRLASQVESATLKARGRENIALSANSIKKKSARKANGLGTHNATDQSYRHDPFRYSRTAKVQENSGPLSNQLSTSQSMKQPTSPMRIIFLLLLFVIAHLVCFGDIVDAEKRIEVKTPQVDSSSSIVSGDAAIRRNIKGGKKTIEAYDVTEEERGSEFASKMEKLSKRLSKQVKSLWRDSKAPKLLRKASLSKRTWTNVKAYFKRLKANSSPIEKAFIIATILLFIVGGWVVLTR